jgi:hypothetical protein
MPKSQERIWVKIEDVIINDGAWVVSPFLEFPLRFEGQPNNGLPKLLRQAGYSVANAGSTERFMPFTEAGRQYVKSSPIDIWELRLPEAGR